jgi:hypothetical protein
MGATGDQAAAYFILERSPEDRLLDDLEVMTECPEAFDAWPAASRQALIMLGDIESDSRRRELETRLRDILQRQEVFVARQQTALALELARKAARVLAGGR